MSKFSKNIKNAVIGWVVVCVECKVRLFIKEDRIMQITHETNGNGLPSYPQKLDVQDVNVFLHDSGMIATHDYSCPCCRKNHAILDLSCGLMNPCHDCSEVYAIVKKKPKKKWFSFFGAKT